MNATKADHSFFSPVGIDEFQVHVDYSGSGYLFVESIVIRETNAWKNILVFWVVLFSLLIDGVVLCYRRLPEGSRRKARVIGATLTDLALFAGLPLMSFFLLHGDDLMIHLNRIEAIKNSLLVGQFPNRVSTFWNDGYGYASAVLYGESFLYVPAILRILGFSVQGAYKFYVFLINLATAFVSYYSFQKVFHNERAALIGSGAYVLAPYRLVCIYMRAAVGEYTAMLFFPLIFYGLMRIYFEDAQEDSYKNNYIALVLGFGGIVQSHVISCVIVSGFTVLFCLIFIKRTFCPARLVQLMKAAAWTFFLNLWFILPFVDYMHLGYTRRPAGIDTPGRMNAHGVFLSQMLTLFQTGYARAYTTLEGISKTNERNYALGAFALSAAIYVIYRLYQGREQSKITKMGDYSLAFGALAGIMCTIWFPWNNFQRMNELFRMIIKNIQFSWRFLGICCFFLTVTTVCLVCQLESGKDRRLYYTVAALLSASFIMSADYYMYRFTQEADLHRFDDEGKLDTVAVGAGEYLLEDTPDGYSDHTESIPGDGVEVFGEHNTGDGRIVTCRNTGAMDACVDLPLLPYRGYVCRDQETGEEFAVQLSVPGRVRIVVPGGYDGTLRVRYEEPWYWRAAEMISALTLLCGTAGLVVRKKRA